MTTRAEFISGIYRELTSKLSDKFGDRVSGMFPSIDEISIADVCFFITLSFTNPKNYYDTVKSFIDYSNITMSEIEMIDVTNIITPYINSIKNLQ